MRLRRQALWGTLGLVLTLGTAIAVPRVVRALPFFRVSAVDLSGARYTDERDIIARLALPDDASILHPLDAMRAALAAAPGVDSVEIRRRWPGTLVVRVIEAVLVALAQQDDRMVVMDALGKVLPFSPTRLGRSLPLADRDSATAALLARLQSSDPSMYDQVDRAYRDGGAIVLERASRSVRLDVGADESAMRSVAAVQAWLDANGTAWREIDARFAGRVFVRKGSV